MAAFLEKWLTERGWTVQRQAVAPQASGGEAARDNIYGMHLRGFVCSSIARHSAAKLQANCST
jgi:hypothetical protein